MQRRERQSCGAIRANEVARIASIERFFSHDSHKLKNLNFGGYSRRVNQSGACSSSDVITSGGRKSETTMEDKFIVVLCGYPELYICANIYWPNTYFPPSFANKFFKNPTMWFSGFYFLILSLIVEVYLWWKLQASLVFLKWENLHNWWLTKYFFAPLYIFVLLQKQEYILQRDWSCLAEAPPTNLRLLCLL